MKQLDFQDDYAEIREEESRMFFETALRWCAYADSIGAPRRAFRAMAIKALKSAFKDVFRQLEGTKIGISREEGNE